MKPIKENTETGNRMGYHDDDKAHKAFLAKMDKMVAEDKAVKFTAYIPLFCEDEDCKKCSPSHNDLVVIPDQSASIECYAMFSDLAVKRMISGLMEFRDSIRGYIKDSTKH